MGEKLGVCVEIYLNRPPAGGRRHQIFDFSGFSELSARFPGFPWSGRARAAPGTHFRAPGSIFHARESNFHAQNRFFVHRDRFLTAKDCFFLGFRLVFVVGEGPGTYFHAQE